MSGHTRTPAEWAQMLSLATSVYATACVPYFLLVDTECWKWPKPLHDAALTTAVLLMLCTPGDNQ